MVRLAWWIALLVSVTGLFVLIAGVLWPGYFLVLWLHWLGGWALLGVGLPALALHVRRTESSMLPPFLLLALVAICALPAISGFDAPDETGLASWLIDTYSRFLSGRDVLLHHVLAPTALAALLLVSLLTGLGGLIAPVQGRRSARWSGWCITLLTAWALATGAAQPWVQRDTLFLATSAHTGTGLAALAALTLHVLSSRLWKREAPTRRARAVLAGSLFLVGGLLIGVHRAETVAAHKDRSEAAGAVYARIPTTAEEREASLHPEGWPHLDVGVLRDSMSCGDARCHPDITHEWAGSAHRFAGRNHLYRAAVDELLRTGGTLADATFCAGCHDPERVLTRRMEEYEGGVPSDGSDGVSCLVCHTMIEAPGSPPSNGGFGVAAAPDAYPGTGELHKRNLLLDPRRHDHVLGVNLFVISPRPCKACHRLVLGPDVGLADEHVLQDQTLPPWTPGADAIVCEECHVDVKDRAFDQYRHEMTGINADLALYVDGLDADDEAALATVRQDAIRQAGAVEHLPITDPRWPLPAPEPPEMVRPGETKPPRALGLRLETVREGGELVVTARLRNQRIGHRFPSGPFDLQQVWLELHVQQGDVVLHHVGALDEQGRIVGAPPRLGARELTAEGTPIERHALLTLDRVEDKRQLGLGGSVEDVIRVPLAGSEPVTVRARWLFRRVNPDFSAWAMPGRAPFPTWELASAQASVTPSAHDAEEGPEP